MENAGWYLALTAGLSALAVASQQFRQLLDRLMSVLVLHIECTATESLEDAVAYYLNNHCKRVRFGILNYRGFMAFVRPRKRNQAVVVEDTVAKLSLFWYGWLPMLVYTKQRQKNSTDNAGSDGAVVIKTIRYLFDPDKFLVEAVELFNKEILVDNHRFDVTYVSGTAGSGNKNQTPRGVHDSGVSPTIASLTDTARLLKWKRDELGRSVSESGDPFALLAMSTDMVKAYANVQFWVQQEQWYRERSIPWKLNLLFKGAPGNGKTVFASALAESFNMPVICFDLASLTNEEFRRYWNEAAQRVPAMILLEDFDSAFEGRENVATRDRNYAALTFDTILNCMDGVSRTDGLLVVITTNKPETLDPALAASGGTVSRPGRVDMIIDFGPPDKMGLEKIAKRILKGTPELVDEVVAEGLKNNDSGAQFQYRCQQRAKAHLWARNGGPATVFAQKS